MKISSFATLALTLTLALSAPALVKAAVPAAPRGGLPTALTTDPPFDAKFPARSQVLHIPSGGVEINGLAYLAAGPGAHPTVILLHGLPGNEKNLDLAQVLRRAGWNAVTFNYRGSWGSPGSFSFSHVLEDTKAVLAYVRDPANAQALGVDPNRLVLAGHSMGGWATALTAARDPALRGAVLISAANLGGRANQPPEKLLALARDNSETLATTPQAMAEEMVAKSADFDVLSAAPGLAARPLLVLVADDGLGPMTDTLVAAVQAKGAKRVTKVHVATDHGWNTARVRLQVEILNWLATLP